MGYRKVLGVWRTEASSAGCAGASQEVQEQLTLSVTIPVMNDAGELAGDD